MNITVMAPMDGNKVREILLANENPKYIFVKSLGIMQTFTVEDADGSHGDLARFTRKMIMEKMGATFNVSVRQEGSAY